MCSYLRPRSKSWQLSDAAFYEGDRLSCAFDTSGVHSTLCGGDRGYSGWSDQVDSPQERVSKRIVEQIVDLPCPQIPKEILEVVRSMQVGKQPICERMGAEW